MPKKKVNTITSYQQETCSFLGRGLAGLRLNIESATKTPNGEILSPTANWDASGIFQGGGHRDGTAGTAARFNYTCPLFPAASAPPETQPFPEVRNVAPWGPGKRLPLPSAAAS